MALRSSPVSMETWPGPRPRPTTPYDYAADRGMAEGACLRRKAICRETKDVRVGPWPSAANRAEGLPKGGSR